MIAALNHKEPDRVPVGEQASDYEMTERVLGRQTYYRSKWREYNAEWEGRYDDIAQSYKRDISELALKLEWDWLVGFLVPGTKDHVEKPQMLDEYVWRDSANRVWQYDPFTGGHAMLIEAPDLTANDIRIPDKVEIDESRLVAIKQIIKDMKDTHFVVGRIPECTWPWHQYLGFDRFLTKMIDDPEVCHKATEAAVKVGVAWAEVICELGVDAIIECTDYCGNEGPIMGPRLFRQFILPGIQQIGDVVHKHGKVFLKHTDGNTWPILDDMIRAGINGWQGIQPNIGMDMQELKKKFGDRLCLFGGVNNETLIAGTPEEVEEEVKYAIKYASKDGGLVITCGNTVQPGVKWENYQAQLLATRQYGQYPISL
jgi:uroporphyrinogen decarboxylase